MARRTATRRRQPRAQRGRAVGPRAPLGPAAPRPASPPAERAAALAGEPGAVLDRPALLVAGVTMLATLLLYLRTISPSLPTGDSGDFITAAWVLGIPHPPGYPLFTLLGHLFTALPLGSVAFRVNLLSALCGALAVGALALLVAALVRDAPDGGPAARWPRWPALAAAATGGLALAVSSAFWLYSLGAEVFSLNALFAALLVLLLVAWERRPERTGLLFAFAFSAGLAATNHQTIVLLAPAFLVLLVAGVRRRWQAPAGAGRRGPRRVDLRSAALALLCLLAGLLPYAYLPLAASADPPLNWGDPRTLERFVAVVTRAPYGSATLAVGDLHGDPVRHVGMFVAYLFTAFTPFGVLLAGIGIGWLWRSRRVEATALCLALLVSGPLFLAYADPPVDVLWQGIVQRFYILPSVFVAAGVGCGALAVLQWVFATVRQRRPRGATARTAMIAAAIALAALPAATAAVRYATVDQSEDRIAEHYADDLLAPLEPNALLITRGDVNEIALAYAQLVKGERTDVVALDLELLKLPEQVEQIRRQHPQVRIPFDAYTEGYTNSVADLVNANLDRPVYVAAATKDSDQWAGKFDQLRAGLANRVVPKGGGEDRWSILRAKLDVFRSYHFPPRAYPNTTFEAQVNTEYGRLANDLGFILSSQGQRDDAERYFRMAIAFAPDVGLSYQNLGTLLLQKGAAASEIIPLYERFLELNPNDPLADGIRQDLRKVRTQGR